MDYNEMAKYVYDQLIEHYSKDVPPDNDILMAVASMVSHAVAIGFKHYDELQNQSEKNT